MKRSIYIIGYLLVAQCVLAQSDTILNRYQQYLFATGKVQGNENLLASLIDSNGQWSDIDYTDKERANWKPGLHLRRVRSIAFAYSNPQSEFFHHPQLLKTIGLALDHWFQKKYICPNWWHNEIGVPQQMRDIIILLRTDLRPEQLSNALKILAQYKVTDKATGANLTWSADLGLHYGLLTNNDSLTRYCKDRIVNEIKITTADGVQPDYSFHQHDKRLQMYQYGAAFLLENVRLAWELRNTPFAFPKEKIDLLSDFLFKGWQWMTRGINTVPGTMDRSASRKNALHSSDLRHLIPYLLELLPEKKKELLTLNDHQNGKGALNGFQYYPYSDFAAYHQDEYSFFIKTISNRTLATESINSENLKGHLLNSGDTYFIHDGQEYFNLMPVWNWEYLPGITHFKGGERINKKSFVGSVGDGKAGLTSMDYQMESNNGRQSITAKKSWFCYDEKVICLMADLKGSGVDTAYTTMDQCRWNGQVTENKKWIHHRNFLYMPLNSAKATVHAQQVTGSWTTINATETPEKINDSIFMPVLWHTKLTVPQSFGYMVAYCKTPPAVINFKILRNDSTCQAISFADGTLMAAFWHAGKVGKLKTDQPCLVMVKKGRLLASDPEHKGKKCTIQFNNRTYNIQLPNDGSTVEIIMRNQPPILH